MHADPFPSEADRSACEAAVRRFEDAWRQPSRPDLAAFVPPGAAYRDRLLLELAHVDLELRIRAGEAARVEDYLTRFPELAGGEALLALLATEIEFRRRRGDAPSPDEYRRRFPHLADHLTTPLQGPTLPPVTPADRRAAGPLAFDLPGYELLGEVGRGGMGVVYLARQTALNRTVALKTLDPAAGAELLARFRREAEAMARLDHPHIVPVYEVGSLPAGAEGTAPYFTMKWYPGGSLDRRPGGPGSDPTVQAGLVETVARAVHHAHQRGVLHRDLKPSNVLLDENDRPHVADFGLAGLLDAVDPGVHTAGPLGTPAYMAPEQARTPRAVTTAADVYGLGALLYHLLAGRPPFQAETALATLVLAGEQAAPPPSAHHPAVSRDLDVITLKCLEKDPGRRYPSAEALADDLARWRRGEPITARPAGVGERAWRWAARHPALAGMALLTALALLTTLVTLAVGNAAIRRREEQTQAALRREQRRLYLERVASAGRLYGLNRLRQAWQLLDACTAEHRGWEWRYLDALRRSVPAPLTEHPDRVSGVAYLADGQLVTADASGELRLWDADRLVRRLTLTAGVTTLAAHPTLPRVATADGRTVTVWDVTDGSALARTPGSGWAAFSPDGTALAVADGPAVQLLDARRLETLQRLTGHGGRVLGGVFAPGRRLVTAGADRSVRVWDLSSGQTVATWRHALEVSSLSLLDQGRTLALAHAAGVALTDPLTGRLITSIGAAEATQVTAAPRRGLLALADRAGEVVVRDVARRRTMRVYRGHDGTVSALAFSGDERFLVSGGIDQTARRWDLQREPDARSLLDVGAGANGLAVSADGRTVAVAPHPLGKGGAGVVRLLDATTGEERLRLPGGGDVAFDPAGRQVAFARGGAVLLHALDGQPVATLGGGAPVTRLAFSPDGAWLAAGDLAGTVRLFDRRRGNAVETVRLGEGVYALAFAADGSRLIAAGGTRTVAWQLPARTTIVLPRSGGARAIACSADGVLWATADRDRVVRLRDAATGEVVRTLPENPLPTEGLAFSPDGSRLATGGEDGVRLWDVTSGQLLLSLPAGTAPVRAVAWDAAHDRLFALGDRLRVWETRRE